jgi:hypothetical protein
MTDRFCLWDCGVHPSDENPRCENHGGGSTHSGPPCGSCGLPTQATADGSGIPCWECRPCRRLVPDFDLAAQV